MRRTSPSQASVESAAEMEGDPWRCAWEGDVEGVKRVLKTGHVKHWINKGVGWGGNTPLYLASSKGHFKIVKILLASGAAINCADNGGSLPLHQASRNGHLKVVRLLLSSGANINCREHVHGMTPLDWASINGHLEVVRLLLSSRALVTCFNKKGCASRDGFQSPVGMAFREGHFSVVETFIEMDKKEQLMFQDGGSLLHVVCREEEVEMDLIKMLLERGLDASKRDKHDKQPVDYLHEEQKKEISDLINATECAVGRQQDLIGTKEPSRHGEDGVSS